MSKSSRISILEPHDSNMEIADDALLLPSSMEIESGNESGQESVWSLTPSTDEEADLERLQAHQRDLSWVLPIFTAAAIGLWTAYFIWAHRKLATQLADPTTWITLIGNWAPPVLLLLALVLLFSRSSYIEARRFSGVALSLSGESVRLEKRLTSVNHELSLARNFLESQTRDLETLSRISVERISQHAEQLQSLIQVNTARVDSLATVSAAALENMEKLRSQLPVITTSARDVTNNIGNAGRTAHSQLQDMILGFRKLNDFGQASERQVESLRTVANETLASLVAQSDQMGTIAKNSFAAVSAAGAAVTAKLAEEETAFTDRIQARKATFTEELGTLSATLTAQEDNAFSALQARAAALFAQVRGAEERHLEVMNLQDESFGQLQRLSDAMEEKLKKFHDQIAALSQTSESTTGVLFDGLKRLDGQIAESREALSSTEGKMGELTDAGVRLLELLVASAEQSSKGLPMALSQSTAQLEQLEQRVMAMRDAAKEAGDSGQSLKEKIEHTLVAITSAVAELDLLQQSASSGAANHGEALEALRRSLAEIEEASGRLDQSTRETVARFETLGGDAAESFGHQIAQAADQAIQSVARDQAQALSAEFQTAAEKATSTSRDAAVQLRDQLGKVSELAGNLERRVAQARERAEETINDDFSRRVALITESLNSNAIDIARALDAEVADTAWASYLKGDRGIFARRTIALLTSADTKSLVQMYENDRDFHDLVSRYIHDFEFMLRQVLSTREGNALGVTLLSSDMGKIYVALAQAIERLRT